MPIKLVLTADNHIGLGFRRYPEEVRSTLVEERFLALDRLIDQANTRQADFFVVAGDFFDRLGVPAGHVKRAIGILKRFEGTAALLLPGNHDYCEGPDSKLWTRIQKECLDSVVVPMMTPDTHKFMVSDRSVQFFSCPCPSKTGSDPMTDWVTDAPKEPGVLHLGVAHGNVVGLGLDLADQYFSMHESDLAAAGVATWLLGHVHVPAPAEMGKRSPGFFMPGTHTPDAITFSLPGQAWWIEFEDTVVSQYEQLTSGAIRFVRLTRKLEHATDIESIAQECKEFDPTCTVIDLELSGKLTTEDLSLVTDLLNGLREKFLSLTYESEIAKILDAETIARRFPSGTLPGRLLNVLIDDGAHPDDAHLALELIEGLESR